MLLKEYQPMRLNQCPAFVIFDARLDDGIFISPGTKIVQGIQMKLAEPFIIRSIWEIIIRIIRIPVNVQIGTIAGNQMQTMPDLALGETIVKLMKKEFKCFRQDL